MPSKIWLGGVCAVPMACRNRDKTIMTRVKLVIINKIDGNSVSTVIRPSS